MNLLHEKILQKSNGETRLNPDEHRLYMGTFGERVIATADFELATSPIFQQNFSLICQHLLISHTPLILKLSPKLTDSLQIIYMKTAQNLGITVSIVEEHKSTCPFALLFHTDHAIQVAHTDIKSLFPELFPNKTKENKPKQSFWKKLFH